MTSKWVAPLIMLVVITGCCGSVFFLELLVKQDPGCVNMLTCFSFLFVAAEGFVFTTNFGKLRSSVPLSAYAYLVILYFIVSVINNLALSFNISMPLHMIFKGASLFSNMLTGMYYFGRRYKVSKYLSVAMVSIGVIICTIASGKEIKCCDTVVKNDTASDYSKMFSWNEPLTEWGRWLTGVAMMTVSLFLGARMGVFQEHIYIKYGKFPQEALYYTHLLPLPGFLFLSHNIYEHFMLAVGSKPLVIPVGSEEINLLIPSMIAYLIGYVLMQYICILFVFLLTGECTSLTVNLVLTLRKIVSLLFSVIYFRNPFTWTLGFGSVLVFGGTLLFSDVPQALYQQFGPQIEKLRRAVTPKLVKQE